MNVARRVGNKTLTRYIVQQFLATFIKLDMISKINLRDKTRLFLVKNLDFGQMFNRFYPPWSTLDPVLREFE